MNYKIILKYIGLLVIILGLLQIFPLLWALYYNEPEASSFLYSIIISIFSGLFLFLLFKNASNEMYRREAFATVGFSWIFAGIIGAIPYMLTKVLPNFFDAFFESISGFTTTGSTVLTDIESVSNSLLFWRSMTHWLGGMGIIVLFVALFPFLGVGGRHLLNNETPGPVKSGIKYKTVETARYLWYIYIGLSLVLILLLYLGDMNLFESICHSFGTMATGGFSTYNKSIGHYNSLYIETVITIFMFFAGINFALYYGLFRGEYKPFLKNTEFKTYFSIIIVSTVAITLLLSFYDYYPSLRESFRYAAFQVVAIITTTGYGTADFNIWHPFCKILLLCLMFVGGCAGSTGGGMKIIRIIVIFKFSYLQIKRAFNPHTVYTLKIENNEFPQNTMYQIIGFFIIAILIFIAGTMFVALHNIDIVTSASSVAATLWNIGPGLERVGSIENFYFLPNSLKFVLSIFMVIGRLELFTILILLFPSFWKK